MLFKSIQERGIRCREQRLILQHHTTEVLMDLGKDVGITQGNPAMTLVTKGGIAHVQHVIPQVAHLEWL